MFRRLFRYELARMFQSSRRQYRTITAVVAIAAAYVWSDEPIAFFICYALLQQAAHLGHQDSVENNVHEETMSEFAASRPLCQKTLTNARTVALCLSGTIQAAVMAVVLLLSGAGPTLFWLMTLTAWMALVIAGLCRREVWFSPRAPREPGRSS